MTYTNKEYAEMADKANKEGKILKVFDDSLVLGDMPPKDLEAARMEKNALINLWRDKARVTEGALFNDDLFDIDEKSQSNILAKVIIAQIAPSQTFLYRSKSNVNHEFTAEQVISLGMVIGGKVEEIYQKSWHLKEFVEAAQTVEEVEGVSWND